MRSLMAGASRDDSQAAIQITPVSALPSCSHAENWGDDVVVNQSEHPWQSRIPGLGVVICVACRNSAGRCDCPLERSHPCA